MAGHEGGEEWSGKECSTCGRNGWRVHGTERRIRNLEGMAGCERRGMGGERGIGISNVKPTLFQDRLLPFSY
jgi:hypothetical protein